MTNAIKKTFTFDKIAFYGGKRINLPEVEVELEYKDKGPVLSICGSIWNSKHTDCVCCGQCLDTMMKFSSLANNALFKKLHRLWTDWHLNDLKCGGPLQEAALKDCQSSLYGERCSYLESKGLLYEDGIKYGAQWWYKEIPEDDLKEIIDLLS